MICGLHLFYKADNSDYVRLEELKRSIRKLQERGILVKLSYGGDEWGNLDVYEKTASWVRNNANVMVRTIEDLGTVFENYSKKSQNSVSYLFTFLVYFSYFVYLSAVCLQFCIFSCFARKLIF